MTDGLLPDEELRAYQEALDFLFGRIDYEKSPQRARSIYDFKLTRMEHLLELVGNPQLRLPVVHIAGTKGKGSTATMVARILEEAGYRTALFTSPHMVRFEERLTVNGREPDRRELIDLVCRLKDAVSRMDDDQDGQRPTFFELSTALGWFYFLDQQAEIGVIEVGLGGRLDSTNLCHSVVTAITSISRDHTRLLGDTLEAIAREKAGIIKPGVPVVIGRVTEKVLDVITEVSREKGAIRLALGQEFSADWSIRDTAPYTRPPRYAVNVRSRQGSFEQLDLEMPGEHQAVNAAVAVGIAVQLREQGYRIDENAIRNGLLKAQTPLRTEVLGEQPLLVVDAAHNEASIGALCDTLRQVQARRRIVIFGASKDKDVRSMLQQVGQFADELILTRYLNNPRAVPVDELKDLAVELGFSAARCADSPHRALELSLEDASPLDLVCTTGSFFLAAEMRELLLKRPGRTPAPAEVAG